MNTSYLIKNASILGGAPTDLLLEDGVIRAIGASAAARTASRPSTPPA